MGRVRYGAKLNLTLNSFITWNDCTLMLQVMFTIGLKQAVKANLTSENGKDCSGNLNLSAQPDILPIILAADKCAHCRI
jgi:hypothetical protein